MRRFQFLDPPQGPQRPLPQATPISPWKLGLLLLVLLGIAAVIGILCWNFILGTGGEAEDGLPARRMFGGLATSLGLVALTGLAALTFDLDSIRLRIAVLLTVAVIEVVYGLTTLTAFFLVTPWASWWAALLPVGVFGFALYVVAAGLYGTHGYFRGTHDRRGFPIDRSGYQRPVPSVVSARQLSVPVHPLMRKYAALPAAIAVVYYVLLWAFTPAEGPDLLFGPILLLIFSAGSAMINVGYGGFPEMRRRTRFELRRVMFVMSVPFLAGLMAFAQITVFTGWEKLIGVVQLIWAVAVLVLHGIGARTRDRAYIQVRREFAAKKQGRGGRTLSRAPRTRN